MLGIGVLKCQRIKLNQTGSNYFSMFVIDIIKVSMQWSSSSSKMLLPYCRNVLFENLDFSFLEGFSVAEVLVLSIM